MNRTMTAVVLAVSGLVATAQAQTNPPTPPSPGNAFSDIVGYFSSFDTNLTTFEQGRFDLWTGVSSIQGGFVPLVNDLGLSYDVWRPKPANGSTVLTALSLENVVRNSGVAGTLTSEQGGLGFSIIVWDVKLTLYGDAGYDIYAPAGTRTRDRLYGEFGIRAKKALGQHFYAGVGIGAQLPRNSQVFSGLVGATF